MEIILGLLAVGIVLAIPVCIIVLLVGQSRLKARTVMLERAIEALRTEMAAGALTAPVASETVRPVQSAPIIAAPSSEVSVAESVVEATVADVMHAADGVGPGMSVAGDPVAITAPVSDQDRPLVVRRDLVAGLTRWLRDNWVYAISALSLALAGVFFVQYGVEKGLLPPAMRVLLAVLFGATLIAGGEWLRRRHGDDLASATAYLPAVFSGAGLVSIFAGLVAGRQMYELYSAGTAFAGLFLTAAFAVVLGWRNGPLLVAIGLLGAAVTPFLVAGPGDAAPWLFAYYGLIAVCGLAVDALRRWAWVSVLALVLGYGGGFLMQAAGAGSVGWIALLVALAVAAVAVPVMRMVPDHGGPSVLQALSRRDRVWPGFPVRLADGAMVFSSFALAILVGGYAPESQLAFAALTVLALLALIWAEKAPGLVDLALWPAAAFLGRLYFEGLRSGPLAYEFSGQAIELRMPESAAPWTVSVLLLMAVTITLGAAWRAFSDRECKLWFGLAAVIVAPAAALLLELCWQPVPVLGAYPWALQIMALAALMVALAMRFARTDGEDHRRFAYAALSALSLIALALFLVTTQSALTLALAALVVVAAGLDRRFNLPEMGWFVQLGVAVLGWRITVDPGLLWALEAPQPGVSLTFIGVIAALVGAIWLLLPLQRTMAKGVLESGAAGFAALFANVLISRWLGFGLGIGWWPTWVELALNAMPWLVVMLVQLYRMPLGGPLRKLRMVLAAFAGVVALGGYVLAAIPFNPLLAWGPGASGGLVKGPLVLDTLLVAYGLPGLILIAAALQLPGLARVLRFGFAGVGAAFAALYLGLEIRRFWQGDFLGASGVIQAELYSYTIAMMLLGAGLLYQAIARHSPMLRRLAMAVIALTVAKVFFIDASGLTGLTRVVSFLGLGLSLAGLAWLNRWAAGGRAAK
jgi:uncharacterized membrane protein